MTKKLKKINASWSGMLAVIAVVLMIGSMFSGVVAASDNPDQRSDDQYKIQKERFEDTKKSLEDSLKQYRGQIGKGRPNDLKEGYRNYQIRAIDHFAAYLDVLKYRLETAEDTRIISFDASGNIAGYIKELEQIRSGVRKAETRQDLINESRKLRDLWLDIRLSTKYDLGLLWLHRASLLIEKADNVSTKVSEEVQKLKAAGKNTTELEAKLARYNELIAKAEESRKKAEGLYEKHEGFDTNGKVTNATLAEKFLSDANRHITETNKYLKEAFKVLREIFRELVRESKGTAFGQPSLVGEGGLDLNGTGRIVLAGNLTVNASGGDILIVSPNARVTGETGTNTTLGNGNVKYQGYGNVTITGDSITVEISGNDIHVRAEGKGSAIMAGNGSYHVTEAFVVRGTWSKT